MNRPTLMHEEPNDIHPDENVTVVKITFAYSQCLDKHAIWQHQVEEIDCSFIRSLHRVRNTAVNWRKCQLCNNTF